ncbi:hypothetical protein BGW36DRAFT_391827 [Talaromyces proteolyticus]|uniref:Uncharacterized protein n=1 Tax=Talaromyces proteolyticus TaxID=1131652 RepID=A0AAD4KD22_9EURO|nr:uncharacterized protein BGW36DRAFT_391827 [Talaromyces proteolyticus]KAH8689139.1 hypothetical protein BGW36DRAFT_391827 [Talaromyces proteolyticus]
MAEEASETTPLLAGSIDVEQAHHQHAVAAGDDNNITPVDQHYSQSRNRFLILTWLSVFLAIIVLIFGLVVMALCRNFSPPDWYMDWEVLGLGGSLTGICVLVAFIGFLNLVRLYKSNRPIWLWFNFICDFFFIIFSITFSLLSFEYIVKPWDDCKYGSHYPHYPNDGDIASCQLFSRNIHILVGFWASFSLVLGLVILVLFLLRWILAYNIWSWDWIRYSNWRWSIPTGVITVEFSIKFLRQEERGTREQMEQ